MSSSKKRAASSSSANKDLVDTSAANRCVFLVKVPRYLSSIWEQHKGHNVARLVAESDTSVSLITTLPDNAEARLELDAKPSSDRKQVNISGASSSRVFKPNEDLKPVTKQPTSVVIPDKHIFRFRNPQNQELGILLEDKSHLKDDIGLQSGKLSIEGRTVKRAEVIPPRNDIKYMELKSAVIRHASQPDSMAQRREGHHNVYKPVAKHVDSLRDRVRKDPSQKNVRADRNVVMDQLFAAFQKHQFYRINDLQAITKQPPNYLRDILSSIAVYHTAPPHKSTYELKPEYRNYVSTPNTTDDPSADE